MLFHSPRTYSFSLFHTIRTSIPNSIHHFQHSHKADNTSDTHDTKTVTIFVRSSTICEKQPPFLHTYLTCKRGRHRTAHQADVYPLSTPLSDPARRSSDLPVFSHYVYLKHQHRFSIFRQHFRGFQKLSHVSTTATTSGRFDGRAGTPAPGEHPQRLLRRSFHSRPESELSSIGPASSDHTTAQDEG